MVRRPSQSRTGVRVVTYLPFRHPLIARMLWRQRLCQIFGLPPAFGVIPRKYRSVRDSQYDSEFFTYRGGCDPWHRSRDARSVSHVPG